MPIFLVGTLLCHPMLVISMRTINLGNYGYQTCLAIAKSEKIRGFYKGYLAALPLYLSMNYKEIKHLI